MPVPIIFYRRFTALRRLRTSPWNTGYLWMGINQYLNNMFLFIRKNICQFHLCGGVHAFMIKLLFSVHENFILIFYSLGHKIEFLKRTFQLFFTNFGSVSKVIVFQLPEFQVIIGIIHITKTKKLCIILLHISGNNCREILTLMFSTQTCCFPVCIYFHTSSNIILIAYCFVTSTKPTLHAPMQDNGKQKMDREYHTNTPLSIINPLFAFANQS